MILVLIRSIKIIQMKTNWFFVWVCVILTAYSSSGYAQNTDQSDLLEDQNPNYRKSKAVYLKQADSLNRTQGTTVQQTYKAYDWYMARKERIKLRQERNYQIRLNRSYYADPYPYYSPYIDYGYRNRFGCRGYMGYGWGNSLWGW